MPETSAGPSSPNPNEDSEIPDESAANIHSISSSVSSSIFDYEYEHGRRYHAYEAGKYHMPNDERESERLDLSHHIWGLTLGKKLYRAPIPTSITNALDIGTGTGIWAIDFADEFPQCTMLGTDLSPIQPTWIPPNIQFIIDDADSDREWIFPPMDFIHSRAMAPCIRDWKRYMSNCYQTLKPGGWIELQESELPILCDDGSCEPEDPILLFGKYCIDAFANTGIHASAQRHFTQYLAETGFVNIHKEEYQWPLGPWTDDDHLNEIGMYMIPNATELLNALSAFFTRLLDWKEAEVEVFRAQCRASLKDPTKHRFLSVSVHYAQKPQDAASSSTPGSGQASNESDPR